MIIQVICVGIDPCSHTTCSRATNDCHWSPISFTQSSFFSCFMLASHSFRCLAFIPVAATQPLRSCPTMALNPKSVGAASGTSEGSTLSHIPPLCLRAWFRRSSAKQYHPFRWHHASMYFPAARHPSTFKAVVATHWRQSAFKHALILRPWLRTAVW
jgi:hypothetical protein